jgi:hypothetical protein
MNGDGEEAVVVTSPNETDSNKKDAKQVMLPPMLINSKLEHVELTEDRGDDGTPKTDPETGARIMKAHKIAGAELEMEKLTVEMLHLL